MAADFDRRVLLKGMLAGGALAAAPGWAFAADPALDPVLMGQWGAAFWEGGGTVPDMLSPEQSAEFPAAVNLVALPDGRILYWNGLEGYEDTSTHLTYPQVAQNDRARVLDPRGPSPAWTIPTPERGTDDPPHPALRSLFCADQKLLPNGTVLIAGGQELPLDAAGLPTDVFGIRDTWVFDPATDTFTTVGSMAWRRWYPSLVTLANGRALALGGVEQVAFPNPDIRNNQVIQPEIYDPVTTTWTAGGTPRPPCRSIPGSICCPAVRCAIPVAA